MEVSRVGDILYVKGTGFLQAIRIDSITSVEVHTESYWIRVHGNGFTALTIAYSEEKKEKYFACLTLLIDTLHYSRSLFTLE